jgi:hypothetical protein
MNMGYEYAGRCLSLQHPEVPASVTGIYLPFIRGCRLHHIGPNMQMRFCAFPGDGGRFRIGYYRVFPDINILHITAEFNGDTVRVKGIDRMDKAVVYHLRDPESCCIDPLFQRPELLLCLNPKGYVVKDKGTSDHLAMFLFSHRFDSRPFKERDRTGLGDLKKIVPVAWLTKACNESHA